MVGLNILDHSVTYKNHILDLERLQRHVYKVFDTEETGFIDLRKMMLVIIALSNGDPEENVEMMFYTVDLNNDGVITAEVNC